MLILFHHQEELERGRCAFYYCYYAQIIQSSNILQKEQLLVYYVTGFADK